MPKDDIAAGMVGRELLTLPRLGLELPNRSSLGAEDHPEALKSRAGKGGTSFCWNLLPCGINCCCHAILGSRADTTLCCDGICDDNGALLVHCGVNDGFHSEACNT